MCVKSLAEIQFNKQLKLIHLSFRSLDLFSKVTVTFTDKTREETKHTRWLDKYSEVLFSYSRFFTHSSVHYCHLKLFF